MIIETCENMMSLIRGIWGDKMVSYKLKISVNYLLWLKYYASRAQNLLFYRKGDTFIHHPFYTSMGTK